MALYAPCVIHACVCRSLALTLHLASYSSPSFGSNKGLMMGSRFGYPVYIKEKSRKRRGKAASSPFPSFFSSSEPAVAMGGTLEYLSGLLGGGDHGHKKRKKRKQLQTVELKVRMDCEGCELKVKNALSSLKGVQTVEINRKQQKVTVTGYVEAGKVLKKAQSTGKKAEIWPYVPYNLVSQPYIAGAYDKKAPPGYVRNVEAASMSGHVVRQEDQFTNMFNDENPNACSIM